MKLTSATATFAAVATCASSFLLSYAEAGSSYSIRLPARCDTQGGYAIEPFVNNILYTIIPTTNSTVTVESSPPGLVYISEVKDNKKYYFGVDSGVAASGEPGTADIYFPSNLLQDIELKGNANVILQGGFSSIEDISVSESAILDGQINHKYYVSNDINLEVDDDARATIEVTGSSSRMEVEVDDNAIVEIIGPIEEIECETNEYCTVTGPISRPDNSVVKNGMLNVVSCTDIKEKDGGKCNAGTYSVTLNMDQTPSGSVQCDSTGIIGGSAAAANAAAESSSSTSSGSGGGNIPPKPAFNPNCTGQNYRTIVDIVCTDPDLFNFCKSFDASAMNGHLRLGEWTLFAPINSAYDTLPAGWIADVSFHAAEGAIASTDLECTEKTLMSNGYKTRTACNKGVPIIQKGLGNGIEELFPKFIETDIEACNGVVHKISNIMLFKK